MTKKLAVLIDGAEIGHVIQNDQGKFWFVYDDAYRRAPAAIPLSISMPLSVAEHGDKAIRPFLWGLLPDNPDTLSNWGRRFGANPRNPFALLSEVGRTSRAPYRWCPQKSLVN
jgi:serine/threonine-protein kinase HipA